MIAPGALIVSMTLLVALGSCPRGEESRLAKPDYERRVQALYDPVHAAFRGTRGLTGTDLAEQIGRAQAALRHAGAGLAMIRPPRDIESEHRELAKGLPEYAELLGAAHQAARGGNETTLARFQDAASTPVVQRISSAARSMKAKGYVLGALTGG